MELKNKGTRLLAKQMRAGRTSGGGVAWLSGFCWPQHFIAKPEMWRPQKGRAQLRLQSAGF